MNSLLTCITLNICFPITSVDVCAPKSPLRTCVLIGCSLGTLVIFLTVSWVSVETIRISAGDRTSCTIICKLIDIVKWCSKR